MKDTISRQAAIEVFRKSLCASETESGREYGISFSGVEQTLKSLPSAQPEIIRCNSCKHWTQTTGKMKGYGLGRCDFHDADLVTCNGFCYWAERRTDG